MLMFSFFFFPDYKGETGQTSQTKGTKRHKNRERNGLVDRKGLNDKKQDRGATDSDNEQTASR